MSKATWTEGRYGLWTLDLRFITCTVQWGLRGEGYVVQVGGQRLKHAHASIDNAKRSAERYARRVLAQSLALIPDEGGNGEGSDRSE